MNMRNVVEQQKKLKENKLSACQVRGGDQVKVELKIIDPVLAFSMDGRTKWATPLHSIHAGSTFRSLPLCLGIIIHIYKSIKEKEEDQYR